MGGAALARSPTRPRDVDRRIGDLRSGQHPPDRVPLRPALRGEPALREGPGAPAGAARRRSRGAADRRVGRRAASRPGVVDTDPEEPGADAVAVPAGARRTGCSARSSPPTSSATLLARVGIATEPARRRRPRSPSPAAPSRSSVDPGDAETRASRPSRPGGATSRSRPTSPRRSPASAATRRSPRSLPHTPMPPYRHVAAAAPRRGPRDARRRRADRGGDLRARVAGDGRARSAGVRGPPSCRGGDRATGDRSRVTNPLSSQHSVMRQSLLGSLARGRRRRTCGRAARTSRSSRSARATARPTTATTHEWWRLGLALTGAVEPPAWNRPARRPTSTTRRASIELLAGGLGSPRPTYAPLTDDPNLHPGRAARARVAAGDRDRRPWSASCIPLVAEALELRAGASSSPSWRSPGCPAASRRAVRRRRRRATRPSSATSRSIVADGRPGGRRRGVDPGQRRRAAASRRRCSTSTAAGRSRRPRRASPIGWRSRRDDRTLTEAEVDAAVAAGHRRARRGRRGSPPRLTREYRSGGSPDCLRRAESRC